MTFELTTRMKAVQRSRGDSATAKAAYRACARIRCAREGRTHDYTRKGGLAHAEIVLPEGAPSWARDREALWNAVELAERNKDPRARSPWKANAQVARDFLFSMPAELSPAGRLEAARAVAGFLVSQSGVAVDFAIHHPGKDGDQRNWHCHLMFTTRQMTPDGLGKKTRAWDERKGGASSLAKQLRAFVARTLNATLRAEGVEGVHVEHRTYKERGSGKIATRHLGPAGTHTLRKDQTRARDAWVRAERQSLAAEHARQHAALKARQDSAWQAKAAELVARGKQGEAAIRRELDAARAADRAPQGMQKAFLAVTGRAGREAFDRQARDAERVAQAGAKLEALKAEIRAERDAFRAAQTRERQQLEARHQSQERQLQQAAQHRQGMDRTAERQVRHDAARAFERAQQHSQERGGQGIAPPAAALR